ncbi:MAG TPA: tetratricopeptide repeat protein, partial [Terriglobales bacterium]|nr:tetratricopeptide repeat protein [Terriglobales bacterium]
MTTEDWLLSKSLRVLLFDELEEYRQVIATLDEHLRTHAGDAVAYNNRGLAHSEIGDANDALRDFGEAIRHAPADPIPLMNRGDLYLRHKPQPIFKEAIADFDRAITLKGDDPSFHRRRAHACLAANLLEDALKSFDRAIELDPEFQQTYVERAELYARLGDAAKADRDRRSLRELQTLASIPGHGNAVRPDVSSDMMPVHAVSRS